MNNTSGVYAFTTKDKKLRIQDSRTASGCCAHAARSRDVALTTPIQQGNKPTRVTWCGSNDYYLLTTGHGASNQDRECSIWDLRKFGSGEQQSSSSSAV